MAISRRSLRFFLTPDPADPSAPLMQALRVWAAAILAPLAPGMQFPVGGLLAREASTPIVALACSSVVLLIAAGWRTRGGTSPGGAASGAAVDAWFCRICALVSIVAFVAMTGVRQGFGDYMVIWISMIGVMNAAALAAWLFTWLFARLIAPGTRGAANEMRVRWIVPVVTSACLIAATAHGAIDLERLRAERMRAAQRRRSRCVEKASTSRCARFSPRPASAVR